MSRVSAGPRLVLFGPDTKHNARKKRAFTKYIWYIVWYEARVPRERSTGFEHFDAAKAQDELAAFLLNREQVARPDAAPRPPSEMAIAECLRLYAEAMEEKNKDPKTPVDLERIGNAIDAVLEVFGEATMDTVDAKSCRDYAKERAKEPPPTVESRLNAKGQRMRPKKASKPSTSRRDLVVLRAAMNWCVRERKLTAAQPMELPSANDGSEKPYLSRDEAAVLLKAARQVPRARSHMHDFILFGLYTGARKGAALDVQWRPNNTAGHVDLTRKTIDFNGRRPRNRKRRPHSVIPQRLRCFLPRWRAKRERYVIEFEGQKVADIKRSFGTACATAARFFYGKAMEAKREGDWDARHKYLQSAARFRAATPHILRHTCITWLLQAGHSCWEVGRFVGDTEETIQRVYGHHSPMHQAGIANAFSRAGRAEEHRGLRLVA